MVWTMKVTHRKTTTCFYLRILRFFTLDVLSPRLWRTGLPWGPCPIVWLKLLETVWFLARFEEEEEEAGLDVGGGGGGLLAGWTNPGEPVGPRGVRLGLEFGTVGLGLEGGRGGPEEGRGGPLKCVGVDPTGLGLGERLGEEF